jgi:mannan endo-1,4-beta-mannosidase
VKSIHVIRLACFYVFSLPASWAVEPANSHSTPQTRATLEFIASRANQAESHLISGQFTNYGTGAKIDDCERAFRESGRWPAMIGVDYAEFGTGGLHFATPNRLAIEYARNGGLVTISAHLYNPTNPRGGGLRDKDVDLKSLLDPASQDHKAWVRELDILADGLKQLRDAGVVVLWRPFHEMNGNWFWWGGKEPAAFVALWRDMFDYFSKTKGLDNLIWVYSPNHGDKVREYYPGDKCVDLVGLDAYTDFVDNAHIKGYQDLKAIKKPFGFTEFGPHGPSDPPGTYEYGRFLEGVKREFPTATFFLAWHNRWGLGQNRGSKALMNDPWVIDRAELPPRLAAPGAKTVGRSRAPN